MIVYIFPSIQMDSPNWATVRVKAPHEILHVIVNDLCIVFFGQFRRQHRQAVLRFFYINNFELYYLWELNLISL